MLSNTATPIYYSEFRRRVLSGEILVNREISMEMSRIDEIIEDPRYYYDPAPVEGFIKFCESEMTLTDGSDLKLLDTFKVWAERIYGWYYFIERTVFVPNKKGSGGRYVTKKVKRRLINKMYLIVGRGAAKSLFDSLIEAYELVVNSKTTHQIATAPTMRQAEEILTPIKTAIARARGPLFKFLTMGSLQNTTGSKADRQKLASTKKGIESFLTNSLLEVRPMSIQKLQGLRCLVAVVDEWLSCDIREDPIGAIEQGAKKNPDWLIIATSSEGTIRNGPGDTIKMELMSTLKGEYPNVHTAIFWYKLDSIDEVSDPAMWIKANPNIRELGMYEAYQDEVERMENAPATRNDTLAKRFGIPTEGYTYFFTYEQTLLHRPRDYWKMPCSLGIDLSQGDDFCAFLFLFPLSNGRFGIKARCYISSYTYQQLHPAMRERYGDFIKEGSLFVLEGTVLDMMEVYDDLDQHIIDSEYDVCCLGFDPYNAKEFINRWEKENGPHGIEKVIQGMKTESVPLGEIQKMAEKRDLLFDQEIMKFSMGNCIVVEDTNGNRKLLKRRYEDKIDPVSALLDAWVSYKVNKDDFI